MNQGVSTVIAVVGLAVTLHASTLTATWEPQMTRSGGMAIGLVSPVLPTWVEETPGLSLGSTSLRAGHTSTALAPAQAPIRLRGYEPMDFRPPDSPTAPGVIILPTGATIDNLSVVFLRYIVADAPASGDVVRLDNLQLRALPIPEPSTAVTLICGLAMLFGLRRLLGSRR